MLLLNRIRNKSSPPSVPGLIQCPRHPRPRPEGSYFVNSFLTPHHKEVLAIAQRLMEENGWMDDPLMVFFNFVSTRVKHISDRKQHGLPEYWSFAFETLNSERLKGDCEDVSWALSSLLLAIQYLDDSEGKGLNIYGNKHVRVSLGAFRDEGHAWVDVYTDFFTGEWGWYTVEPTSNSTLMLGVNAWAVEDALDMGYEPELYVYDEGCKPVGERGLYDRLPLVYGRCFWLALKMRWWNGLKLSLSEFWGFILDAIS